MDNPIGGRKFRINSHERADFSSKMSREGPVSGEGSISTYIPIYISTLEIVLDVNIFVRMFRHMMCFRCDLTCIYCLESPFFCRTSSYFIYPQLE